MYMYSGCYILCTCTVFRKYVDIVLWKKFLAFFITIQATFFIFFIK